MTRRRAALYELLIAAGAVGIGGVSGDGAPAESWFFLVAAVEGAGH